MKLLLKEVARRSNAKQVGVLTGRIAKKK